jgi:hypothetical protein
VRHVVCLLAAVALLALLLAAATASRDPVRLAVRISLAVETPPATGAGLGWADPSGTTGGRAAVPPSILDRCKAALTQLCSAFWRVSAVITVDAGAVVVESAERGSARVPATLGSREAGILIRVAGVGPAGEVELWLGEHRATVLVGGTVDAALEPAAGGGWLIVGGPGWRQRIEERLAAGTAVGRLSITNLGRGAAGRQR